MCVVKIVNIVELCKLQYCSHPKGYPISTFIITRVHCACICWCWCNSCVAAYKARSTKLLKVATLCDTFAPLDAWRLESVKRLLRCTLSIKRKKKYIVRQDKWYCRIGIEVGKTTCPVRHVWKQEARYSQKCDSQMKTHTSCWVHISDLLCEIEKRDGYLDR